MPRSEAALGGDGRAAPAAGAAPWYEHVLPRMAGARAWPDESEAAVTEAYRYLDAHPGKEIRSRIIDALQAWLPVDDDETTVRIKQWVRRLHTASLLLDDVEDSSELRRGVPAAHTIYGVPQTINTANYVCFQVVADMVQWQPRAVPAVTAELVALHRGQGIELFWRESLQCPSEAEYVDMVVNKTGGLFRIAVQLLASAAGAEARAHALIPLVNLLGLLFQIRDDYMNLHSGSSHAKGFCEDLTEGKFSFPLLHAIRTAAPDRTLLHILRQRTQHVEPKKYVLDYLSRVTHSFDYTHTVLTALEAQARTEMERLGALWGANPALAAVLDALHLPPP
ncbi:unnamed protein product [Malassezia sympodialis ATCC 42132]|uniref:(2E,6E)-farnesyl diphosphate synthase n=1 Tax=Malassezia sympodialis (strain ATCC 42132) TaxID=1230383 RepID=M5ERC8_MALS4|nr:uncharacterized protein MSY001_3085 [Malassezia sympodialis ATCC 42132]CCV00380.1 unnamed protein product [Malassezia sympodialis ATCC 42132]SHO79813.1 Similar to S.cerevisiae protein BTS1 (Geranylgeranyl diphosphate synthase (GGPS)) [Malassezia sympodialis ATCC 42132]|eukprot:XP_018741579.1 uncharacterized protein MSY001_3085 [Malassezia sympodialis ATCC 42132]